MSGNLFLKSFSWVSSDNAFVPTITKTALIYNINPKLSNNTVQYSSGFIFYSGTLRPVTLLLKLSCDLTIIIIFFA